MIVPTQWQLKSPRGRIYLRDYSPGKSGVSQSWSGRASSRTLIK